MYVSLLCEFGYTRPAKNTASDKIASATGLPAGYFLAAAASFSAFRCGRS